MMFSFSPSMPFEEYLSRHDHCSPSILKRYAVNPILCKVKEQSTKAMDEGTAFHAVMDGSFRGRYIRGSEGPCNRNPWKAEKKALEESNPGSIILSAAEYDGYIEMSDSVYLNRQVGPLLERIAEKESSYFWYDSKDVPCKARPDAVTEEGLILDFKSTTNIGPDWWRDALRYQYDLTVAHYLDEKLPFYNYAFIVVSKVAPYFTMLWKLSADALTDAYVRVRDLRDKWNDSRVGNNFVNAYDEEFTIPRRLTREAL